MVGFLAIMVMAIAALQAMAPAAVVDTGPVPPGQRLDLVFQGQYTLGASALFENLGDLGSSQTGQLVEAFRALDVSDREAICLAPVFEALGDSAAAESALGLAPTALSGDAQAAARVLRGDADADPDADEAALERYCGWFGELALARAHDDAEALAAVRARAVRLTMAVIGVAVVGLGALVVGCVLAVLAFAQYRRGSLGSGYRSALGRVGADVPGSFRLSYLETIVFFLLGLQILGIVTGLLIETPIGLGALLVQWAIVPLIAWPLVRGEVRATLGAALGWFRPRSILAEVAWGVVAYVASAPLLALGLFGSIVVSRLVPQTPYHPIMDWVQGGDTWLAMSMVLIVAVVWAPLVEETMFRGAFYHYLRGRLGVVGAAVLVASVFAFIHPQGLIGVPFLVALAVALAITREWRGSLIASVTMHALHNSLAIGFLFVVVGGL